MRRGAPAALAFGVLLAGCGAGEPDPEPSDLGTSGEAVGDFILHVSPRSRRMTVHRLSQAAAKAQEAWQGPGLCPEAMADVNLKQDGTPGSGPANSVELVTNQATIVDTYNTGAQGTCPANSFCADVTLDSFWTRPLNYTYVQVTAIVDDKGNALSGHSATNSDTPRTGVGLSNTLGLWMYTSPTILSTHFSNLTTGVVAPGASNGATVTWKFANPDDADTNIRLKVWAATTYSNYSVGTSGAAYVDACTVGARESALPITNTGTMAVDPQPVTSNNVLTIQLPFVFDFYGTSYPVGSIVGFSKWGNVTVGSATASVSDTNLAIPSTSAPKNAAFIFWDQLRWAASGTRGLCAKLTGSAPNRQVAISWERVGFTGAGPSYMTFGVVLNESTEEVWFIYETMAGASPTGGATVGAQNETGKVAAIGSTSSQSTFNNGTALALLPLP